MSALLRAAHLGPALAVTAVAALLGTAADLATPTVVLVTLAILSGQLTIGWGNDLLDAERDRLAGRTDKPLATGTLSAGLVRPCLVGAAVACVVLSFAAGWRSGLLHVLVAVPAGHAYNVHLKRTAWSWLPYAVAFGSLPAIVWLAGPDPSWPPAWMLGVAAVLGVAAHFLNTLPDFADDAATGVQGLPHRLGATRTRVVATVLLVAGSVGAVVGAGDASSPAGLGVLLLVAVLAAVALRGRGSLPFLAAILIALLDVVLLAAA